MTSLGPVMTSEVRGNCDPMYVFETPPLKTLHETEAHDGVCPTYSRHETNTEKRHDQREAKTDERKDCNLVT